MVIVFYTGYQSKNWCPDSVNSIGLGGTEQCVLNLAKQFAYDSEVYVVGDVIEGCFDNVTYITTHNSLKVLKDVIIDCVIGVSYINYLLELESLNFKKSLFWVHNTDYYPWHRGNALPNKGQDLLLNDKLNGIVCLTEWHKQKFIEQFPQAKDKIKVIGNGVDVSKFKNGISKVSNSFIYTSHAERGLDKVLDDWDGILAIKKDAILNISTPEYGLEYFNENFLSRIDNSKNIFFHGSLPLAELYDLMSTSEYWYYPTEYEETFCITALEMLGHGVKPIASELAGLSETLNNFNLKQIKNLDKKLDTSMIEKYVSSCAWETKKNIWSEYICNMSEFNIDCVYIISLKFDEDQLEHWKTEIRSKLLPTYSGPIIGKRAVNGAEVTDKWLSEHDYTLYENWQIKDSNNEYWNKPIDPGAIGCAISHHQIWNHAHKNNFNGILILEEDFEVIKELSQNYLDELPANYDLFYLGRNVTQGIGTKIPVDEPVGSGLIVKPTASYNTHAYILSASGVKSLLDQNFNKYILPVDEFLPACYSGHVREDLSFITTDLVAFAPTASDEIVKQSRDANTSGPRTDLSHRKHPDLYSYWDNPNEWKEKFISYSARTQEWSLIMDEPFDNCFSMPLFTKEFCEKIREEAEHSGKWTVDRHEFYPTTDMLLDAIAMDRIYHEVLKEFIYPASIYAFQLDGRGWDNMKSEDFLAKYVPNAQGHLSLHHDASNITALVTLSSFDEYEGGGTYFSHQKKLIKEKQGYVSIHPGNITHKHGARATTDGTRYIIVSFMKNAEIMK